MSDFVPLFQTLAWIIFLVWILKRYNQNAVHLLDAVRSRIQRGSSVKAGPFELGELIQPQNIEEQKLRLEKEVREIRTNSDIPKLPSYSTASNYLIAEDLAMRAIQEEFKAPVNRQVTVGKDIGLDGIVFSENKAYGIEIKFVHSLIAVESLVNSVEGLHQSLCKTMKMPVRLIFALVISGDRPMPADFLDQFENAFASKDLIHFRFYHLKDLAKTFGVTLE